MRITRLQVDGFGALRDAVFELEGPITVIYGRNEAGKSTLMNFVRYMLFGFPVRGGGPRFEPVGGGSYGGSMSLADGSGRMWRVERYEGAGRASGTGSLGTGRAGGLRITMEDGTAGGEAMLQAMAGGVSAELYRSLFAFGLGELQELRTLQADEVGSYLYGAGFGAGGAAIREAEKRLQQRMDELYRPRGRNQTIALTVKAIDELDAALRRSREDVPRYEALRREVAVLDEALAQLAESGADARERAERLALCLKARPTWLALRALEREWAGLPAFPAFPEAAVSRWETLAAEREALLAQRERLQLRRSRLAERLGAMAEPAAEGAGRAPLLQLLERAPLREQGERETQRLEGERRQLQQRLGALLRSLDASWDAAVLRAAPVTVAERERMRAHRERLAQLGQERSRLQAELEQAAQRAADAKDEVRQAASELELWRRDTEAAYPWTLDWGTNDRGRGIEPGAGEAPGQMAALIRREYEQWRRLEAEASHVRERAEDERRHREQLRLGAGRTGAKQASTTAPITLLLLGLGLAGWLFNIGQPLAAAASLAVLAAAAGLMLASRRSSRTPMGQRTADEGVPLDERLAALAAQMQPLQRRLLLLVQRFTSPAETAASLEPMPYEESPPAYRAATSAHSAAAAWEQAREWLEQSLAEWEQLAAEWQRERDAWLRRLERLGELQASTARAAELRMQAERRLAALEGRSAPELAAWREWLTSLRLPAQLSPDAALESLQLIEQGHALLERDDALAARLDELHAEREQFAAEVRHWLQVEPGETETVALHRWKRVDEQRQQDQLEREQLFAEKLRAEEELEELSLPWVRLEQRVQELLQAASANEEQELRLHARLHERRQQLEQERLSSYATLEAWVGDAPLQRLDSVLSGQEESALERELQLLREELASKELEEAELRDRRGRIAGELDKLERSSEHADRLQRRQELGTQLERQAAEWTELALAVALFRRTRQLYERDKQPFVLQRASGLFAGMTEGRYSRIVAPIGEQRLLAMRPDGETVDPGRLSRGTAEQLYLAMRLAIAAEYTKDAPPPLLLDDILVNFDEGRMTRTLELLGETAKTHHVLLFTCHPHIVRSAQAVLPKVELVEL